MPVFRNPQKIALTVLGRKVAIASLNVLDIQSSRDSVVLDV